MKRSSPPAEDEQCVTFVQSKLENHPKVRWRILFSCLLASSQDRENSSSSKQSSIGIPARTDHSYLVPLPDVRDPLEGVADDEEDGNEEVTVGQLHFLSHLPSGNGSGLLEPGNLRK